MLNLGCSITQTTNLAKAIFGYLKNMLLQCDTASYNTTRNNFNESRITENPKKMTDMSKENQKEMITAIEENQKGLKRLIEDVQKEIETLDEKVKDLSMKSENDEGRN